MAYIDYPTVTVANGVSLSGAINVETHVICAFVTDSGWNTAALSFQASSDGTNYFNLYSDGSELTFAAIAASTWVTIDPARFLGIRHLKVRSGTAGSPVNQTGDSVVTVITRPI